MQSKPGDRDEVGGDDMEFRGGRRASFERRVRPGSRDFRAVRPITDPPEITLLYAEYVVAQTGVKSVGLHRETGDAAWWTVVQR